MTPFDVRPVTSDTWPDFARLFAARGCPHFCWCTPFRFRNAHELSAGQKKASMQALVASDTPIGVLAYEGSEPVGWCSVAPRDSYLKLARSRTMPRVTPPDAPTWTVLCFFVVRGARERGISQALLRGAIDYARAQGARIIEGYPFDTAGISASHRGHSKVFSRAGFQHEGRRWFLELGSP